MQQASQAYLPIFPGLFSYLNNANKSHLMVTRCILIIGVVFQELNINIYKINDMKIKWSL